MELNLRKARKLEAKINAYVGKIELKTAVKIRVLSTANERSELTAVARKELLEQIYTRNKLVSARFGIRRLIGQANESVGINELINYREQLQALLGHSTASLDSLDHQEMEDMVQAKVNRLEKGETSGYDDRVTFIVPITLNSDVDSFKKADADLKKILEDVEDSLAQKNLGAKVTLNEETVSLLTASGLL